MNRAQSHTVLTCIAAFCVSLQGVEKRSADSLYTVHAESLNNGGLSSGHSMIRSHGSFENQVQGALSGDVVAVRPGFIPIVSLVHPAVLIMGSRNGVLIAAMNPRQNGIEIEIHTAVNHQYTVQYQDGVPDPNGTWHPMGTAIQGNGGLILFADDAAAGLTKRFYRIVIEAYDQIHISDPFGYYDLPVGPGPNLLSVPLMGRVYYKGRVSAVGNGVIEVADHPNWSDGALAIQDGFHQYILLLRSDGSGEPGNQGEWWPITNNVGNGLHLDDREDDITSLLEPGDLVEVRRLISLKDLFGHGENLLLTPDSNGFPNKDEEDLFRVLRGSSFAQEIFYHDGTLVGEGYYINGEGPLDGSTFRLLPNQAIMMFRKQGEPALAPRAVGHVQVESLTSYLHTGPNPFGSIFADAVEIGSSGLLESGWRQDSNGFPNRLEEDLLRPVVGLGYSREIYFHDGSLPGADPGWYVDGLPNGAYLIEPLKGYVLFIRSGPRKWRQLPPH